MKLIIIFFLCLTSVNAAEVSLAWDASVSSGVTGYKIYYGTASHAYTKTDTVPMQLYWTVKDLPPGTWFFAATAFDSSGNESGFSNEVSKVITSGMLPVTLTLTSIPDPGPRVTLLLVSSILTSQATVVWQTSADCDGFALWSTDGTRWLSVTSNHLGTTEHLAVVGPLITRTHYFYKVTGTCNGQAIESEIRSFNTK